MNGPALAAVFDGPGRPFRLVELPVPDPPGDGEVVVRISLATICGSDLHTIHGRRNEPTPAVLGHEGVGRVVAAGAGRAKWLGRRVTWTLADSCGRCIACGDHGLPQKCPEVFKYGHAPLNAGSGLHGTYATHIVLRRGTRLIAVPDDLDDATVAPANCALATMTAVVEELPRVCRVAVIQGAGLLGLHGCALLRSRGVARVIVVDQDAARLRAVPDFGGEPMVGSALETLGPGGADLVVETAGSADVFAEGMQLLRDGGHYLLAGLVHPDSALHLTGEAVIRRCLTLRGFHNYAPRHLAGAIDFLQAHPSLPWRGLVSPPLPLDRMTEAVSLAGSRRWFRVGITPV